METNSPITLSGSPGSPYTRKMLALLRYRRIPYRFIQTSAAAQMNLPTAKVPLLPTFYFADEGGARQAVTDSSPIIRRLEPISPERQVVPPDPVVALIDRLLEDYADEWLTKPMFHFRWRFPEDIRRAAEVLPHWRYGTSSDEHIRQRGDEFSSRQIARLGVVGSNDTTAEVIEQSYRRFLTAFDIHLTSYPFLLGSRPSAADFAVSGQLTQLVQFDPTPMSIALEAGGRVYAWVSSLEDLSGLEPDSSGWLQRDAIPASLHALLAEMGRVYTPVMLANEQVVNSGAEQVRTTVDGKPWTQRPFPYQAKCVRWLREAFAQLSAQDRDAFGNLIAGSGLEPLFN
ncbi:MAG: glutathione S-transferase family protein [Burkholderiaceae bacterium]